MNHQCNWSWFPIAMLIGPCWSPYFWECCPQQNKAFESFGVYNRGTRWAPTSYKLIRGVITPISGVNLPQLFSAIYRGPPHNSTYNWIPKRPAACPSSFGNISKSQHIHHAFEDLGGSPWPRFFAISRFRVWPFFFRKGFFSAFQSLQVRIWCRNPP